MCRAGIASSAMPPAITAWTSDSGAIASAATWSPHATNATTNPIVHHFEANRAAALLSGRLKRTSGASLAPLYLHSSATLESSAHPSASSSPVSIITWLSTLPPRAFRRLAG